MELEFVLFLLGEKVEKKNSELGSLERAYLYHWTLLNAVLASMQHYTIIRTSQTLVFIELLNVFCTRM
jgi:hypothetical protein